MASDDDKNYIFRFTYGGDETASIEVGSEWDESIEDSLTENEKLKIIGELMIQFGTRILSSEVGEVLNGDPTN